MFENFRFHFYTAMAFKVFKEASKANDLGNRQRAKNLYKKTIWAGKRAMRINGQYIRDSDKTEVKNLITTSEVMSNIYC